MSTATSGSKNLAASAYITAGMMFSPTRLPTALARPDTGNGVPKTTQLA